MRQRRKIVAVVAACAALGFTGVGAVQAGAIPAVTNQTNLVSDGGFETPVEQLCATSYTSGQSLGTWTVVTGVVQHINTCEWQASEGSYSVTLGEPLIPQSTKRHLPAPGGISQVLKTKVGHQYDIHFVAAGSPSFFLLRTSKRNQSPPDSMKVLANGKLVHSLSVASSTNLSAMGWTCPTYDYTAKSKSTTLELLSTTAGVTAPVVDDVRVTSETGVNVAKIIPSTLEHGATNVPVSVIGSGFTKKSMVTFSDSSVTVTKVTSVKGDKLTILVSVSPDASTQSSDVTVTNGNGNSDTCGNTAQILAPNVAAK